MKKIHYFVEGENEKSLVDALKNHEIIPGKVTVFNLVSKDAKKLIRRITANHIIIIIDTDVCIKGSKEIKTLKDNILTLKKVKGVNKITLLAQVNNLEDELEKCLNINSYKEIYNSPGNREYKKSLNNDKNLRNTLIKNSFDFEKLWSEDYFIVTEFKVDYNSKDSILNQKK